MDILKALIALLFSILNCNDAISVAGDTKRMIPETGLHPEVTLKPLPNIPGLGPLATAKSHVGIVPLSTLEQYGRGVQVYVNAVSIGALPLFSWLTFSGGAVEMERRYFALTIGYGLQSIILSMLLSAGVSSTTSIVIACFSLILGSVAGWTSGKKLKFAEIFWEGVLFASYFILLTGKMTSTFHSTPLRFWSSIISIGIIVAVAYQFTPPTRPRSNWNNSIFIAFGCSCGVVSGLSCINELFGVLPGLNFLQVLSTPSSMRFKNLSSALLLVTLLLLMISGTFVNRIRFRQKVDISRPEKPETSQPADAEIENPWDV